MRIKFKTILHIATVKQLTGLCKYCSVNANLNLWIASWIFKCEFILTEIYPYTHLFPPKQVITETA